MMNTPRLHTAARYCQLCGRAISGRGHRLRHSRWARDHYLRVCGDCYRHKPRCQSCGLPMSQVPAGAEPVCPTCAGYLPHCLTCGRLISGHYFEVQGVGPYCRACQQGRLPCDVCGAPLSDISWKLSDGRIICATCQATAIHNPIDARAVFAEVIELTSSRLGLALNVPTGLALVDRNQLVEIARLQNGIGLHDPAHTLGIYARRGIRRGIYIQTGLPRTLLLQVAAHEYGHAWQGENCPLIRDPLQREGFAEWVAYKIIQAHDLHQQMALMHQRQDLYGAGLHWALALETSGGAAALLAVCRRSE